MKHNDKELSRIASELRLDVLEAVYNAKDGHPGPAFSCLDILTVLYYEIMKIDPSNPDMQTRDRFILSKGHACVGLYAILAKKGYFDKKHLKTLRQYGSMLQGHPVMSKTPGVDMTSGSLGNGLSIGLGMALGCKYQKIENTVYVIIGDGEIQEGIVWEAIHSAKKLKADNLVLFVDCNHFQSGGSTEQVAGIYPLKSKFESFGWHTQEIDGHDYGAIFESIKNTEKQDDVPSVILCNTVKGKGLDFMENDNSWHKRVPNDEQMKKARKVLGGA